jgi:hypothetical protein
VENREAWERYTNLRMHGTETPNLYPDPGEYRSCLLCFQPVRCWDCPEPVVRDTVSFLIDELAEVGDMQPEEVQGVRDSGDCIRVTATRVFHDRDRLPSSYFFED